ncbi:hypothetical protein EV426DRAFT_83778 [Tirmania nivea]|nr:hypothetical protein EV426DRAFT_83778 [Tirmania nivea]
MKKNLNTTLLAVALLLVSLTVGATAQLKYFQDQAPQVNQQPIIMPHEGDDRAAPILSDIISIDRDISVFSGLTRSVAEVGARLKDENKNTTVLAPKNTIITNLPRKPWEDPHDEEEASAQGTLPAELYRGDSGEDRAASNLRKFVEAHLIGISPWQKGKANQVTTLQGKTLWWEEEEGVRKIYPDGIVVEQVKDDVPNGQIWVLNGVINY